jgi:ubiquinone/menaquinone biosynthesis C-methylase UbiE
MRPPDIRSTDRRSVEGRDRDDDHVLDEQAHRVTNQREFARQSSNFELSGSLFRDSSILDWIAGHVPVPRHAQILDVAGGTGQVGRHLARGHASAVIVDVTEEMLQTGLHAVAQEGRHDVTFVRGEATDLPFASGQFDVVICRFALHHIARPAAAVDEMARVCRTGGAVTIVDLLNGGARHDELERLRDPSHAHALTERELRDLVAAACAVPAARCATREHTMLVEPWLEQSATSDPERGLVREALRAEADGSSPTGLRAARDDDGHLTITQRWMLLGT